MLRIRRPSNQEQGFTLVELLIVVGIIAILAAIAIPVYLGVQNQAHKSAVRADVNMKVKTIQAAVTEGARTTDFFATQNGSDRGSSVIVQGSTTAGAGADDFMVIGTESMSTGGINYTYRYDSVTGKFSESDTAYVATVAPAITTTGLASASVGAAYNQTVAATGTPAPTFTATGLPTGLTMSSAGIITGTPSNTNAIKTYTVNVTAGNGTVDATKSFNLVLQAFQPVTVFDTNANGFTGWTGSGISAYPTYMTLDISNYGVAGSGYTTINNLTVGSLYSISVAGGVSGGWSAQNCVSLFAGYSPTSTTSPTTSSTFTATATSMRIYAGGSSSGTGTLHCTFNRVYVQQTG